MEAQALDELLREQFPRERLESGGTQGCAIAGSRTRWVRSESARTEDLADLARGFHDAHQRRYGHMAQARRSNRQFPGDGGRLIRSRR